MSKYSDMAFEVEKSGSRGRIVGRDAVGNEAELTFSLSGEDRIVADHTGVPKQLSGKGVGSQLIEHLVSFARETDRKIVPVCSFVQAKMVRSEEWRPLIAS
ncbi:GNAT family N-acetyltransferase [Parvularcula sp. LCG005]|uniref:GNAT family N-acetyltransferase n=1 Tax=Parvularcula sp. LCG005 TaxID=3078805 RepID=UPI0029425D35|nr:GNAT family N-acetyltransferase [Parvularcula sp. LCG005]WOI54220.1 GNAT family N-acetyltransferase [Parvularcula sp. LCG005]